MAERFYITTAISYPNGRPHIGHAYELIATDAIARFKRLDGYDVMFLTGTDEHGQKMLQTARNEDIPVEALADRNSAEFKRMAEVLDASNDDFIRTTEERHHRASQEIWRRMADAGDIYKDTYGGWYSVREEAFYGEDETTLREDGTRFGPHGTPVTWVEEESYFFKLSAFTERLLAHYEANPDFIGPAERRNEVVSFVKQGLRDLSVSRTTFDWGIPVPDAPGHVMYVWVDALTNYLTATGFLEDGERRDFWPADLHVIGKDIVRFHAVYWPAFLMSAGLPVPKRVFAHGFLFNKGEKMSKSVGNVIDPFALVSTYGLDQFRYFLLREVPFGQDGNYSHEAIVNRTNSELANDLGNLAQRSLSMIAKHCDAAVPQPGALGPADETLLRAATELLATARMAIDRQELHAMLAPIVTVVADANRYFASQEPWALRKSDPARMATVLYVTAETVRRVAILLQPVMPASAAKLLDLLGVEADERSFDELTPDVALVPGRPLPTPTGVFPRYVEPDAA
ncbi:methionine--tRNA ligase [Aureimonas leprariae]|uniref:Methionine--tRNA ligase n=1 Tax=Plantimonas leprariae TaxID=2615207 RepID=A0A7V7PRT7_9HYPH|nr:methionine--tRNA ligase [Aureimonas leprariae]KAB0681753.1 methionine--tRNA ligase [Aureimonas leprariae]